MVRPGRQLEIRPVFTRPLSRAISGILRGPLITLILVTLSIKVLLLRSLVLVSWVQVDMAIPLTLTFTSGVLVLTALCIRLKHTTAVRLNFAQTAVPITAPVWVSFTSVEYLELVFEIPNLVVFQGKRHVHLFF